MSIDSLSAHADADELLDWMRPVEIPPDEVFVVHGEPAAADTLRARIIHELGWRARVPENLETIALPAPGCSLESSIG
ncbi:MBL fold metallo-hydrolase RNA specificity domain-containing protein [Microbacterium rhizomatis]|uniref:MBL fold metallo-hydrolase RNA specificity domain-containing protein n=1 Tax=Microbacterium rhizomatis TaxID=1631477 RepID=UPI001FE9433D|nr:MBL fold metallo-hydrolase RNA specificity domain-containing protein [Microbacterium rhizomatis]